MKEEIMTQHYGIMPVNEESIALAVSLIREGNVVVIPTDTVYGVVADPTNAQAVEKIFAVKHRPHEKTMQVLAAHMDDLARFGVYLPEELKPVEREFMPGAVSVIARVHAQDKHESHDRAGEENESVRKSRVHHTELATARHEEDGSLTQGVRLPASDVTLNVLKSTGPLAASSANLSGHESTATARDAYDQLGDSVPLYLDGGSTPGPVASTVVTWDDAHQQPVFLREGVVPSDTIRAVLLGNK